MKSAIYLGEAISTHQPDENKKLRPCKPGDLASGQDASDVCVCVCHMSTNGVSHHFLGWRGLRKEFSIAKQQVDQRNLSIYVNI